MLENSMLVADPGSEVIFGGKVLRNSFNGGIVKDDGVGKFCFEEMSVREEPDIWFLWKEILHGRTERKRPEDACEFVRD